MASRISSEAEKTVVVRHKGHTLTSAPGQESREDQLHFRMIRKTMEVLSELSTAEEVNNSKALHTVLQYSHKMITI